MQRISMRVAYGLSSAPHSASLPTLSMTIASISLAGSTAGWVLNFWKKAPVKMRTRRHVHVREVSTSHQDIYRDSLIAPEGKVLQLNEFPT
jgi:hypothetical protein